MKWCNLSARDVRTLVCAVFASNLMAASVMGQNPPLPTMEEITTLYNGGNYGKAMSDCQRIIDLRDDSLAGFDRHHARMICAECELHLTMMKAAGDTLDSAANAAMQSGSSTDATEAKALSLLVHDSANAYYIPKTGKVRDRLDIIDPTTRQAAYLALFNDRFEWCEQQQQQAATAETLLPALDLAKMFDGVRALEQISTQSTTQCDRLADQMARRCNTMLLNALNGYDKVVDGIVRDTNIGANRRVHRGKQVPLKGDQIAELHRILSDCQKVPAAVDKVDAAFAQPVSAMADNDKALAQNTADRIQAIFNENDQVVARESSEQKQSPRSRRAR